MSEGSESSPISIKAVAPGSFTAPSLRHFALRDAAFVALCGSAGMCGLSLFAYVPVCGFVGTLIVSDY